MTPTKIALAAAAAAASCALLAGCAQPGAAPATPPAAAAPAKLAAIPKDKDHDLKLYLASGQIVTGADALGRMQQEAGLILWLAGNQFFAMDDVVHAFQRANPGVQVGLITLPPGLLLDAITAGGWNYGGRDYRGRPDVYASVNLGHLKKLNGAGMMDQYAIYMHNELEIMVAKGNPKRIAGIDDLVRPDVRTSMPNPVSEGIMQFYARKVLERHGIWDQISAGKMCNSCQTTPNNWFTSVHHRETPDRIKAGTSDAGIVWKTETLAAQRAGAPVDAVQLPPADSLRDEVSYAIGAMKGSPRADAATSYLRFLAAADANAAYAKYGFVPATPQELALKPIPK
jgi:ABC-type molybdate transport system substrate-binding protein